MRLLLVVIAAVGAFAPAAVSASAQPFKLTLAPAFAIVEPTQHEASFMLVNSGAAAVHIAVTASDAWIVPAEKSFDIRPHERHDTSTTIAIPANADAGDHETDVSFTIPATGDGLLRISFAIASRVIIATGGTVTHDLRVFGLSAPAIADSWDAPTVNLTLDNSRGNTHEVVSLTPFGQALVLRGQKRVLALPWTQHPWIGRGTISADGQSVSTLFLPWRVGLGLIALLAGLLLVRQVRKA